MAVFSLCSNDECPTRSFCRRATEPPSEFQSYYYFKFAKWDDWPDWRVVNGSRQRVRLKKGDCVNFMPDTVVMKENFMKLVMAIPPPADRKIYVPGFGFLPNNDPAVKAYLEYLKKEDDGK